jgi:signal transduction histidine kinase
VLSRLRFRHRIGLLVSLAGLALATVAIVTFVLGRQNQQQLEGIEGRYVPLIELNRDIKTVFAKIPHALEDAASAAEDSKLAEADGLMAELVERLHAGAATIIDNGGDPAALETELRSYYGNARDVSAAMMSAASMETLAPKIELMRAAQQTFGAHLDAATSPDRRRLADAFSTARASLKTSLAINVAVACFALAAMALLSWQLTRRTVRSLQAVSDGVDRLARGEFGQEIDVPGGDELGELAREANRTARRLRAYREQAEQEDWIKTGVSELHEHIAGELAPVVLAGKAMQYVARYVGTNAAAVHTVAEDGSLRRLEALGSDAAVLHLSPANAAALEDSSVRVERAGGRHVIIVPLLHERELMGALELASDDAPSVRTLELMRRIRGPIGSALRVAESRAREHELLAETQRQASAAQVANKELEAFSYSVSHDLRAPLRGIDGFSQALLEDYAAQLPAKGQDYLRRIRVAAQRMAELIDDLLRLSRVSRADFKRERVDLSAIATGVVTELQRMQQGRQLEIKTERDVIASADPRLIRITFENLLGNAWKFTSKTSEPVIEFGVREQAGERVFFVRDNGAGFDMKYADRLFGAFQRLHTDKEFPGTGIGLATVQRIIQRHGGRIWVDAAVGRGATFLFTLPNEPTGVPAS